MLYKKAQEPKLSESLFRNPTSEYRAAPFWAWNCDLKDELLLKEIGQLKEMGMGGFHMHCRVGLNTRYLGEDFFQKIKMCEEEAKRQNMLCWLYDEDRWPSGSAGGFVTRDQQYRTRFLVFAPNDVPEPEEGAYMAAAKAVRSKNRRLIGKYRIHLDEDGYMTSYEKVGDREEAGSDLWKAYLEISGDTPWFNNQAYVNTLDKKAIDRFIELTHEKYYEELKEDFGTAIPAIFTDEPQTSHKEMLREPFSREPVIFPFTDDFEETFRNKYGFSIIAHLPELIWEQKDSPVSKIRYLYHVHVSDRFSEAFGDNIGNWCRKHGIALTGHMMNEWTLHSQTLAIGEVMRPMKNFGLPGIDMLCDRREFSTAKQAQSIAHQEGREGVMSELYGVTGWDFDFRNHKLAGDWQAALGITVRVPHLSWVSMEGEAKRDYPASIGYQSPWYKEYPYIENHFARLNTALTRGTPHVRVGVVHPVESYWIYWGNKEQTSLVRQVLEHNFETLIDWLLFGLIDFDFLSESVLEDERTDNQDHRFHMGAMAYDVVIVPECHTLRKHTVDLLEAFAGKGGEVLFMGNLPRYMDAMVSEVPGQLAARCTRIPFNQGNLLEALERYRDIDITVRGVDGDDPTRMKHKETGNRAANLFYQLRDDGSGQWLFICHVNKPRNEHITYTEEWTIRINGLCRPVVYDTMTGEIYSIEANYRSGRTLITYYGSQHDSLLLRLEPVPREEEERQGKRQEEQVKAVREKQICSLPKETSELPDPTGFELEEENALLLDLAQYAFDGEAWQPEDEILRIDNKFREKLGLPLRMEALAQPWIYEEEEQAAHMLRLRYEITSDVEVEAPVLAMEHPELAQIRLNEHPVSLQDTGWYVDECIRKIALPPIHAGKNMLEISLPFGQKTNVEWCYLLGSFGVSVSGRKKKLIPLPKKIQFGDFTRQGLPFYAGNLVYEVPLTCGEGELHLEFSHYRGALIQVELDGRTVGNVALAPYRINCGCVETGAHQLKIRIFGNRHNAFGPVHNADASETWYGPNLWRTQGNKWSYEYQLKEMGILTTPVYWLEGE
ncbi:hypothetical protein [Diplocloster hominis]|uniref:hypothetical protein n=1 Tax=Diplocloster hominis TaxID=3079010 RepID=UPI0031BB3F90